MVFNNKIIFSEEIKDESNLKEFNFDFINSINDLLKNSSNKRIVVGFDTRRYSIVISKKLISKIAADCEIIYNVNPLPYSQFIFLMKLKESDFGFYISSSDENILKHEISFTSSSEKEITIDFEKEKKLISDSKQSKISEIDSIRDYENFILKSINKEIISKYAINNPTKSSIIIDSLGGATGTIIEDILNKLNFRVQTIFSIPDENFFNKSLNLSESSCEALKYNVLSTESLLGIIFNSNGSEVAFIDSIGNYVKKEIMYTKLIIDKTDDEIINSIKVIEKLIEKGKN